MAKIDFYRNNAEKNKKLPNMFCSQANADNIKTGHYFV
jgi:hypothetical protein